MAKVTFLGHAAVLVEGSATTVVIDPFLTDNPQAAVGPEAINPDLVVVTHAHGDHWGDTLTLAQKGALVVSTYEIAVYAEKHGAKAFAMNIGGSYEFAGGRLKFYPAWHSSSFPDGSYGGMPMGVVLELDGKKIYHAGDTALFSDMKMIGDLGLDLAILPIGDTFTMGPDDALAALELLRPKQVLPIHYNTFPVIEQDGAAFVARAAAMGVGGKALAPGEAIEL